MFLLGTSLIFPRFRFFFFFYGSLWLICSRGLHSNAWIPEHNWPEEGDGHITKTIMSLESGQFWLNQRPMTSSLENHHSLFGSKNEWHLPTFLITALQAFRQGFEHINHYINGIAVWWYIKEGKSSKWLFHHTPEDHPASSLPVWPLHLCNTSPASWLFWSNPNMYWCHNFDYAQHHNILGQSCLFLQKKQTRNWTTTRETEFAS